MAIKNLIDLIAEVAAKRVADKGETKEDAPGTVNCVWRKIGANLWRRRHNFIQIQVFSPRLDIAPAWGQV